MSSLFFFHTALSGPRFHLWVLPRPRHHLPLSERHMSALSRWVLNWYVLTEPSDRSAACVTAILRVHSVQGLLSQTLLHGEEVPEMCPHTITEKTCGRIQDVWWLSWASWSIHLPVLCIRHCWTAHYEQYVLSFYFSTFRCIIFPVEIKTAKGVFFVVVLFSFVFQHSPQYISVIQCLK